MKNQILDLAKENIVRNFLYFLEIKFPIARTINDLLGSDKDPWGSASWWASFNTRIKKLPMELLGGEKENILVQLAESIKEISY